MRSARALPFMGMGCDVALLALALVVPLGRAQAHVLLSEPFNNAAQFTAIQSTGQPAPFFSYSNGL